MSEQFDYLSRILATPMPRSKALRLMFGALAAAALAPLGVGQEGQGKKEPPSDCPPRHNDCGNGFCCPPARKCCQGAGTTFCCPHPHECCGNTCCPPSRECRNRTCVKIPPTPKKP
jgi:hypothetical protein